MPPRSRVDDASRAATLTRANDPGSGTYALSAADFDRDDGWYDFAGAVFGRTAGTFSLSRPDGGQLALTYEARVDDGIGDACEFNGAAQYQGPAAPPDDEPNAGGAAETECRVGGEPSYFVPGGDPAIIVGCAELAVGGRRVQFSVHREMIGRKPHVCVNPAYRGRGGAGTYIPATCLPNDQLGSLRLVDLSRPRQAVRGYRLVLWGIAPGRTELVRVASSAGGSDAALFGVDKATAERVGAPDAFRIFVAELPLDAACSRILARASPGPDRPKTVTREVARGGVAERCPAR